MKTWILALLIVAAGCSSPKQQTTPSKATQSVSDRQEQELKTAETATVTLQPIMVDEYVEVEASRLAADEEVAYLIKEAILRIKPFSIYESLEGEASGPNAHVLYVGDSMMFMNSYRERNQEWVHFAASRTDGRLDQVQFTVYPTKPNVLGIVDSVGDVQLVLERPAPLSSQNPLGFKTVSIVDKGQKAEFTSNSEGKWQIRKLAARQVDFLSLPKTETPEPKADEGIENLPKNWPAKSEGLKGPRDVTIKNPNDFKVRVALRSDGLGEDFIVPAYGLRSVKVSDGSYTIYFQYSNDPNSIYQGDNFTLNNTTITIKIGQVVDGNYSIRKVQ